jgi:hypothetical protein
MNTYYIAIFIGVISLYYIYKNAVESFTASNLNMLNNYVSNYSDGIKNIMESNHKFIKKFNKYHVGNTTDLNDDKVPLMESAIQNASLVNAIKIYDYINRYTYKVKNIYDVCYKNGNPCNRDCMEIDSRLCQKLI